MRCHSFALLLFPFSLIPFFLVVVAVHLPSIHCCLCPPSVQLPLKPVQSHHHLFRHEKTEACSFHHPSLLPCLALKLIRHLRKLSPPR
jgi:hypothetical protein